MPRQFTKKQRAELKRLQDLAWERELENELASLEETFRSWRDGEIDAFDVSDEIHQFHDKRARRLYSFYLSRDNPFAVPSAIAKGIIRESEVSDELIALLRDSIEDIKEGIEEYGSSDA